MDNQKNSSNTQNSSDTQKMTEFEKERHYATQEAVKFAKTYSDPNTQGRIMEANFEKYWD